MEGFACKRIDARNGRQRWFREKSETTDEEPCVVLITLFIYETPDTFGSLPECRLDPRIEYYVFVQVLLFSDVLNVFEGLRLWRESFLPMPLVQDFLVE